MAIKAKEIARQLGVSESTFSLVVNGKPGISAKTRERVLQGIRELGCEHLIQQAAAAESACNMIGFVLYKKGGELLGCNSFFPLIMDEIENAARGAGYCLTVITIEHSRIREQIRYIAEARCSGFVVFATEMKEDAFPYFEQTGLPWVLFDNDFISRDVNSVVVNNRQGTYRLVRYLYELGHRKIGYLCSGLDINSFLERRAYAMAAMQGFGLKNPERYAYTVGYPSERAEQGMAELLRATPRDKLPTAFLADNDLVSVGAMQATLKAGYRVPDDFSFVGFDDRPVCTVVNPRLTTFRLPRERFGAEAVMQLVALIACRFRSSIKVEINGSVVVRESCKRMDV